MEQQEITRRNVAIATYMGWEYKEVDEDCDPRGYCPPESGHADYHRFYFLEDLEFHKNYNWIMPCVEKVALEEGVTLLFTPPNSPLDEGKIRTSSYVRGFPHNDTYSMKLTPIESVWMSVSEFCLSQFPE